MNSNKIDNSPNEMMAYQLAMKLYDNFYNTLMVAVTNSVKNFDGAIRYYGEQAHEMSDPTTEAIRADAYYMGKRDAFREISERIVKEHDIACQDLTNWLEVENKGDINEVFAKAVKNTWIRFVNQIIKDQKNSDVNQILPDCDFRGRRVYDKIMRMRGQLASLLEYYGWEGFQLGRKYEQDTIKIEDVQDFDPKKFADQCIETFVPEDYKDF